MSINATRKYISLRDVLLAIIGVIGVLIQRSSSSISHMSKNKVSCNYNILSIASVVIMR